MPIETNLGRSTVRCVVWDTPYLAVSVTEVVAVTGMLVTLAVPEVDPAGIVIDDAANVAAGRLLLSLTTAPPGGAGPVRLAVTTAP